MIKYTIYHEYEGSWFDGISWNRDRSKAKMLTSNQLDDALESLLTIGKNLDVKAYIDESCSMYKLSTKYNWSAMLESLRNGVGRVTMYVGHREFTYTWGATGSRSIKEFILDTDSAYFCNKMLSRDEGSQFSAKQSIRRLKRAIADEYPYYKHLEFQKDLRKKLNTLGEYDNPEEFIDEFNYIVRTRLDYDIIKDRFESKEVESFFNSLQSCAWEYLDREPSGICLTIQKMHKVLKSKLSKELKAKEAA